MLRVGVWSVVGCACVATATLLAEEHRVAKLAEPLAQGVSAEIGKRLADGGCQVFRGEKSLCRLWMVNETSLTAEFKPTETVLYPFTAGELLGVIQFDQTAEDFRGQEIAKGLYTLRYAWQPVDGNHVGTSLTRDFLLMLPVDQDTSPDRLTDEQVIELSKAAAESSHPAMLSLLAAEASDAEEPSIHHEDHRDLWSVQFTVRGNGDAKVALRLVVAGHVEG